MQVSFEEGNVPVESISGFVMCAAEGQWWLGCVLQLCADENLVKPILLHPSSPTNSYKYPPKEHIVTVELREVLTTVYPRSRSG